MPSLNNTLKTCGRSILQVGSKANRLEVLSILILIKCSCYVMELLTVSLAVEHKQSSPHFRFDCCAWFDLHFLTFYIFLLPIITIISILSNEPYTLYLTASSVPFCIYSSLYLINKEIFQTNKKKTKGTVTVSLIYNRVHSCQTLDSFDIRLINRHIHTVWASPYLPTKNDIIFNNIVLQVYILSATQSIIQERHLWSATTVFLHFILTGGN